MKKDDDSKVFNERRRGEVVVPLTIFAMTMALGSLIMYKATGAFTGLIGMTITFVSLISLLYYWMEVGFLNNRTESPSYRYALLEKSTGRVARAGLRSVTLHYRSRYKAESYPIAFAFAARVSPITANPNVVPLRLRLEVIADEEDVDNEALVTAIFKDERGIKTRDQINFPARAFEIFYHRLPHVITAQLNPYNPATIEPLLMFVKGELAQLPFKHEVFVHVDMT